MNFKEEDLKDIRKYLDLRNQYKELEKNLEKRLRDIIDMKYGQEIIGIETHKIEIDKKGKEYIAFGKYNDKAYKQSSGRFVYQETVGEDDYWGYMFFPLEEDEYLRVIF